jgi:D,D-heptose 1,7-bisphosphate phosphatase
VQTLRKAAFLDRDGVINVDRAYVSRWEDFEFVPGTIDAMRALKQAGFALVVVTNQSGIARGYYTEDQFQALTITMNRALAEAGAAVDAVYHCPHHPSGAVACLSVDCDCRKPAPGMIFRAARELNLSLSDSILVGDKPSDIQAARAAGVGRAFIIHSYNADSGPGFAGADATYFDLYSCVADLCGTPLNLQNE